MTAQQVSILCAISVSVDCHYDAQHSDPSHDHFHFIYDIRLSNQGSMGAKLLQRHWFIMNGHRHVEEVRGPGVVGEHPYLGPGDIFEYRSSVMIDTPVGNMYGTYEMIADNGQIFMVEIKNFALIKADSVH